MMTPKKEAEIRARREKATGKPWRIALTPPGDDENEVACVRGIFIAGPRRAVSCGDEAEFIKHAPQDIDDLLSELAALRAVVERLPKTADGVPVFENDVVFTAVGDECYVRTNGAGDWYGAAEDGTELAVVSECYSTRAAAEAAKGKA